jgi:hypothetical protein
MGLFVPSSVCYCVFTALLAEKLNAEDPSFGVPLSALFLCLILGLCFNLLAWYPMITVRGTPGGGALSRPETSTIY